MAEPEDGSHLETDLRGHIIMKRFFIIFGRGAAVVALLVTLAILSNSQEPVAASAPPTAVGTQIEINNFAFTPATITIPVGTQVTWTNKDDIVHNVVSADKSIRSKALDTNDKFTFTFTQAGTFSYVCTIHPMMKGTVVVK